MWFLSTLAQTVSHSGSVTKNVGSVTKSSTTMFPTLHQTRYLSTRVLNTSLSNNNNNVKKNNSKVSSFYYTPLRHQTSAPPTSPPATSPSSSSSSPSPPPYIQYQSVVITLAGPDRAGIVHELSEQLEKIRGNIEESRMTILGNDFAVILLASIPQQVKVDELRDLLTQSFPGFIASARPTAPPNVVPSTYQQPVRVMRLAVEGPDQPGVVRALTELLYKYGVSIRDLDTDTSSAPFAGYKVFSLKGIIAVPTKADFQGIDSDITQFEEQYGFDVELVDANEDVDEDEDEEMDEDEIEEQRGGSDADDTVPNVISYDRRQRQAVGGTISHHPHTHYAHHPTHPPSHPSSHRSSNQTIQDRIAAAEAERRRRGGR